MFLERLKCLKYTLALALLMAVGLLSLPALALELEVWSYDNQKIPQAVLTAFEKEHPGLTINQWQPAGDFRGEQILVVTAAGVPPALLHLNADFLPMYVVNNIIEPLTPWVNKGVLGNLNSFFPAVVEGVRYQGEFYFLPHRMSVNSLLYNRQHFEESGLDADKPPQTWTEFKTLAKHLTVRDSEKTVRHGAAFNVSTSTLTSWYQPMIWQAGGEILDVKATGALSVSEAGRVAFNSDAGREALNLFAETIRDGYVRHGTVSQLRAGTVAMMWQSYSTIVKNEKEAGRDWIDVGPILSHRERVGYGSLAGWVVPKSAHVDLAVELLAHTMRPENLRVFLAETSFMPVRRDIGVDYFAPEHRGWMQKFVNEVPYTRYDILHPEIRNLQPLITGILRKAALGEVPPENALAEAERLSNQLLKDAGF